ncbi:protein unc-93 homolog A-like [Amphiura filiformis]|uniref:protein unc-93 homolog A-like n=1 Tax=Amphiura filiformis TaxID=82378 RepID=UPI003B217C48
MVFGTSCWCVYIACNFYPKPYILLPVSTLIGVIVAPFWVAQSTHITTTAIHLASVTGETAENLVSRFAGISLWFQKFSAIPGNLISSFILYEGVSGSIGYPVNRTLDHCGGTPSSCIQYIADYGNTTDEYNVEVNQNLKNTLFGVLLGCCFCGVVVSIVFIDTLSAFCEVTPPKKHRAQSLALTALRIMKSRHFALLVPIIALNGLELSFFFGTFTKSFVSCTTGVENIGFVMTAGGIGGALAALVSGTAIKYTGRMVVFTVGFFSQLVFLMWMFLWQPYQAHNWDIYVMAVGLGAGSALRTTQITALVGMLFAERQEGAFGSHLFFHHACYSLGFALNIFLCAYHQMMIMTSILTVAIVTYYVLEYDIKQTLKSDKCEKEKEIKPVNINELKMTGNKPLPEKQAIIVASQSHIKGDVATVCTNLLKLESNTSL